MRTDSTRVSNEAVKLTKSFVINNYGKAYSNGGKTYTNKSKKKLRMPMKALDLHQY